MKKATKVEDRIKIQFYVKRTKDSTEVICYGGKRSV